MQGRVRKGFCYASTLNIFKQNPSFLPKKAFSQTNKQTEKNNKKKFNDPTGNDSLESTKWNIIRWGWIKHNSQNKEEVKCNSQAESYLTAYARVSGLTIT